MTARGVGPKNDPWFRMHHKLLNDPVVQMLSAEHFKIYINLLCYVASIHKDGYIGNISAVSFALRVDVTSCFMALHEVGLIGTNETDDETLHETFHIPQWSKMQYKSDTSTDRVRKHRERKSVTGNVTGNVTETPQKQSRAEAEAEKKNIQKKELSEAIENAFEDFYQSHPKRTKKKEARAKFNKLVAKATLPEEVNSIAAMLIADMGKRLQAGMWSTAEGQRGFIPGPAPYLNGEMWNDEIVERGNETSGRSNQQRPTAREQQFEDLVSIDFCGGANTEPPPEYFDGETELLTVRPGD